MSSSQRKPNAAARRPSRQQAARQAAARRQRMLLIGAGAVGLVVILGVIALVLRLNHGGGTTVSAAPVDGVQCGATEGQAQHIHQHLDIVVNGQYQPIPANVGIILSKGCLYWVHTHTPDGVIHVEAPVNDRLTLGTFLDIWSASEVDRTALTKVQAGAPDRVIVDGKPYSGDVRAIPLQSHSLITLEYGTPDTPQRPFDWVAAGLST